jgi:hypothetical protein
MWGLLYINKTTLKITLKWSIGVTCMVFKVFFLKGGFLKLEGAVV